MGGERGQSWSCSGADASWRRIAHAQEAPAPPASLSIFRRWKSRAAALLERQGIPAGPWGRERDLRQVDIRAATPEQAVEQVHTQYWNTRSFQRMRSR
jgi:hypothetical protein